MQTKEIIIILFRLRFFCTFVVSGVTALWKSNPPNLLNPRLKNENKL